MSNRVTYKDLQNIVDRINRMTNSPMQPYVKEADGKFTAQIGNYHLSHAYGGVSLHRMVNTSGGGVSEQLYCDYVPKRELQSLLWAYIRGMEHKS